MSRLESLTYNGGGADWRECKGLKSWGKDGQKRPISTQISILRNGGKSPSRNGSLALSNVEMALFGTIWHCLRGVVIQKGNSENELGKTKNGVGTLANSARNKGSRQPFRLTAQRPNSAGGVVQIA